MIEICCAGLQMVEHKAQRLALAWVFTDVQSIISLLALFRT